MLSYKEIGNTIKKWYIVQNNQNIINILTQLTTHKLYKYFVHIIGITILNNFISHERITIKLVNLIIKYKKDLIKDLITFKYFNMMTGKDETVYQELYFLKLNKQDYITYFINPLMENIYTFDKKTIILMISRLDETCHFNKLKLLVLYLPSYYFNEVYKNLEMSATTNKNYKQRFKNLDGTYPENEISDDKDILFYNKLAKYLIRHNIKLSNCDTSYYKPLIFNL